MFHKSRVYFGVVNVHFSEFFRNFPAGSVVGSTAFEGKKLYLDF